MAGKDKEAGLSKKDVDKILKDLKKVKDFIKMIEKMGGSIPAPLKKSLNRLELAIKAGKAVGEAAEAASKDLRKYEKDLMAACKTVDSEMQAVCEAKVARKWQARGVDFTLNYKNPKSVSAKLIDKAIKKLTPAVICKHWDRCAKIDKKKK